MLDNNRLDVYLSDKKAIVAKKQSIAEEQVAYIEHNIEAIKFANIDENLNGDHAKILEFINNVAKVNITYNNDIKSVLNKHGIRPKINYIDPVFSFLVNVIFTGIFISAYTIFAYALYYHWFVDDGVFTQQNIINAVVVAYCISIVSVGIATIWKAKKS